MQDDRRAGLEGSILKSGNLVRFDMVGVLGGPLVDRPEGLGRLTQR